MTTKKKVFLIVILGVGASLLTFLLGHYFSQRYRNNQHLLAVIQQMTNRIGSIHLLSMDYIHSGDPKAWQTLTGNLAALRHNMEEKPPVTGSEKQTLHSLEEQLRHYEQLLKRIHDLTIQLNLEKGRMQQIRRSFLSDVKELIITPCRKEEKASIYQGRQIDPIKIRIKETAYNLMGLHTEQQLLLTELLLDWDMKRFRQQKTIIATAMNDQKNQLHDLDILMRTSQKVIRSLGEKQSVLIASEQKILNHFSQLPRLNHELTLSKDRLTALYSELSSQIWSSMAHSDKLNRNLSWGLLLAILCCLVGLGFMPAKDIIGLLETLRTTQFSFDQANIGIYRITPDARIVEVNPKAAQLLGFTQKELASMSIIDIDPHVTRESWLKIWDDLLENRVHFFETTHCRQDGSIMPVEVYGSLLEFEDQQFSIAFVQDITERKQIEQDLKENRERLDLALEGANQGIWDWRIDTGTIHFDSRYYTMAGYEPGEFPPAFEEWEKRLHKDDITRIKSIVDQYITGDIDTFDAEFRFLRKDGTYMCIHGKGKIVARNEQGTPTRFIGTHSDITGRKQTEKALRDNERLLSNILESMDEGLMVLDGDFKYRIVNKKLEEYGNTPREEMIGKKPWKVFESIRNTVIEDNIRKTMTGEQAESIEIQLSMPHGTHWFRDSFSSIKNERGQVLGVVGVVSDISRQKQDEEELRRLRNYLSNIINSMPSILVAVDGKGRVTQWNSQTERITGISLKQAQKKSLETVFPRLSENMAQIREAIEEQKVITLPKVARRMEQKTCFEDITIFPLEANGEEGAVIRVDDITEQVRLEEIMIQSEKMLTVGGLAAGMAHEINNPLASMLQTAGVMQNRLGCLMDIPANRKAAQEAGISMEGIQQFMTARGIHRMLEAIIASGKRAADIVNNMLSFVRKGDEGMALHQMDEIVESTLALAATDYNQKKKYDFKKIRIIKEYGETLPPALCNSSKIQQVLLNILGNGAQAMQEAETEAPLFIVRTFMNKRQSKICLAIEDNGPGMDETTCKKIFDPFFTTKPVGQGTGLGLSVSYFIITENHGGEMTVESKPGKGTAFTIKLPVQRQTEN